MQRQPQMRSVEASRAAWQTNVPLTRSELLVLQALAHHANADFECFPSFDRLARMTRLSRRQVIRLVYKLRDKGLIAFEENPGGRQKCNRYCLLIARNGDTVKADNCDILNGERVTSCAQTATNSYSNGDIARSPEGFSNGFEGVREGGKNGKAAPNLKSYDEALEELEADPKSLYDRLTKGMPIVRNEVCNKKGHGTFLRKGFRWGNWTMLNGAEEVYSPGFSYDAGCTGCRIEFEKFLADASKFSSLPLRFELTSPLICPVHGDFTLQAILCEFPQWRENGGERFTVFIDYCPHCEADLIYNAQLQEDLGLSNEQWERGGKQILAALDFIRGV